MQNEAVGLTHAYQQAGFERAPLIQTPARRRASSAITRTTSSGDAHRSGAEGLTPLADAEAKFRAQGVTADKHVICYCGGGISATIDLFLLHQLGYDDLTLYDGSMGEWAKDLSLPIETD